MHLCEVLVHRFGEQVPHIFMCCNLLADIAGGDVHHGYVDHGYAGMRGKFAVLCSRAGIDEEAVVVEEILVVAPAVERVEVVAAHDKAELAVGVFLL